VRSALRHRNATSCPFFAETLDTAAPPSTSGPARRCPRSSRNSSSLTAFTELGSGYTARAPGFAVREAVRAPWRAWFEQAPFVAIPCTLDGKTIVEKVRTNFRQYLVRCLNERPRNALERGSTWTATKRRQISVGKNRLAWKSPKGGRSSPTAVPCEPPKERRYAHAQKKRNEERRGPPTTTTKITRAFSEVRGRVEAAFFTPRGFWGLGRVPIGAAQILPFPLPTPRSLEKKKNIAV